MVILGVSAFGHDAAAAVLVDGTLVAACEEERLSRVKHDGSFPEMSIAYCLKEANVAREDIDCVAFYHDPWLHIGKRFWHAFTHLPRSVSFLKSHGTDVADWTAMFGVRRRFPRARFEYVEHHLAHAASAFYPSPFREAAVLSVDGMGEWDTTLLALGTDRGLEKLDSVSFPHSLGIYYEALTQYLGFRIHNDEFKVMGLSAYGSDRYHGELKQAVRFPDGRHFCLDLDMFTHHVGGVPFYSESFVRKFGPPRREGDAINPRHEDIARAGQQVLEEALLRLADALYAETGTPNLCIGGGVGLNCVANGRMLDESPFRRVFVQPASYDSGCAIGCCYFVYHDILGFQRGRRMIDPKLGPRFDNSRIEKTLVRMGVAFEKSDRPEADCALALSEGKIVGWFQDRMEFGPRALGARSILADPRRRGMKTKVNRVKKREAFRPFAPSVLEEKAAEYFETDVASPYMLFVRNVRDDRRKEIPSVTHVDGTARLQTVSRETSPGFHRLIAEFDHVTGVPVVLNTSLNLRGEPIACTPEDAVGVFARSRLDGLFIGNYVVKKT